MPAQPPETILQFGSGKFLRCFADLFVQQINATDQAAGRVVVVQSTGAGRAALFNARQGAIMPPSAAWKTAGSSTRCWKFTA